MEYLILVLIVGVGTLLLIGLFEPKTSLFWLKNKRTRLRSFLIYFFTLLILFGVLGSVIPESEKARIETEQAKKDSIRTAKKEEKRNLKENEEIQTVRTLSKIEVHTLVVGFVKEQLKAPSTAKIKYNPDNIYEVNDSVFIVKGFVDSQNSFGAMTRTNYSCQITYYPSIDRVKCENLVFE